MAGVPVGVQATEMPLYRGGILHSFRWQDLLNTHLINEVFSFQVGKMRTLFVIREVSA
jgi:hypothetical protein